MPYLIEIMIVIVLLMTIALSIMYFLIISRSDEIKKVWESIIILLNQRVLLLRNVIDSSHHFNAENSDLLNSIKALIVQYKDKENMQEKVEHALLLSNEIEQLIDDVSLQNDVSLQVLASQLNELDTNLWQLWYQYNCKVYEFNEWVSKFPIKGIAIMFGIRRYDYILLDDE